MSLFIFFIVSIFFLGGYIFYGRFLNKLFQVNPNNKTPAFEKYDRIDYVPAKNWFILFGHHFSSIAGAGPVVGSVMAVMLWGWLPALLWVVLGTIFIGGVHDFSSLLISVREGGVSIGEIATSVISKRAKILFSLFIWLALILVITVFTYLCADTFIKQPKIPLPSLGLIPVALIVGHLLYNLKANTFLVTIFALLCLFNLIILGNIFAINFDIKIWFIILLIYSYIASILPVNVLLQPRDYISAFLLFFGIFFGFIGLIFSFHRISMPAIITNRFSSQSLWPFMFVTIACGAISGFHSLICSGTTSKQIASELHIRRIGYGAMVLEGFVAVLAIIAVSILNLNGNFSLLLNTIGPIALFAKGYGIIVGNFLGNYGEFIAVIMLNAFILTTLDTATRISRYLTEELFGIKNRYISTFLIIFLVTLLLISGKWNRIWQLFGASNQLVAAFALFTVSSWLIVKKRNTKIILLAAFFMFITTMVVFFLSIVEYIKKDIFLFIITFLLILLGIFMIYEVIKIFVKSVK